MREVIDYRPASSDRAERERRRNGEPNMILGFTGTRDGMTEAQRAAFREIVAGLQPTEFHHGDCMGADEQAHAIVAESVPTCRIVIHPPTRESWRAFCKGGEVLRAKPYLDRNRDIVDASDAMVATPRSMVDQSGGTWYTIRYAGTTDKTLAIIDPLGKVAKAYAMRRGES